MRATILMYVSVTVTRGQRGDNNVRLEKFREKLDNRAILHNVDGKRYIQMLIITIPA
jgi:hypothetical protein